jgi:phage anti-repressor protein
MSELATFLKKLSPIPNSFIDDMFELYDPDTAQTDFAVNVEAVAKWLGVHKRTLLKTLRASYSLGIDYIVSGKPNPKLEGKYGRNSYKEVLLTPDCFKRLCMRSKGRTAEDVRTYFIQVEALVVTPWVNMKWND